MTITILLPLVALLAVAGAQTTPRGCCAEKQVSGAPDASLNGLYILKEDEGSPREAQCIDGCVYVMDNEEYCFKEVPMADGAKVECDGQGGSPPTGSTPTGGSTGSPATGSSTSPGSPPTGSSGSPHTGSSTSPGSPHTGSSTTGSTGSTGSSATGSTGSSTTGSTGSTGSSTTGSTGSTGSSTTGSTGLTGSSTTGSTGSTGSSTTGSTGSTGSSTTGSTGSTGSSTTGSTGPSTTSGSTGPTTTAASLEDQARQADEDKNKAAEAIAAAEKEKAAAEETENALGDLDGLLDSLAADSTSTTAQGGRMKRQADTTPYTFEKPSTCAEFTTMIGQVGQLIKENIPKALALVKVLKTVSKSDFTCTPSDIAAAKEKVKESKAAAEKVKKEKINKIAEETDNYNKAVDKIKNVNQKLVEAGKTTINPGTPLPSVATAFIETTPAPSAGGSPTTSGGSPPSSPSSASSPASEASSPSSAASPSSSMSSPTSTSPHPSTAMSTNAPGGRRARGIYLRQQYGIDIE